MIDPGTRSLWLAVRNAVLISALLWLGLWLV